MQLYNYCNYINIAIIGLLQLYTKRRKTFSYFQFLIQTFTLPPFQHFKKQFSNKNSGSNGCDAKSPFLIIFKYLWIFHIFSGWNFKCLNQIYWYFTIYSEHVYAPYILFSNFPWTIYILFIKYYSKNICNILQEFPLDAIHFWTRKQEL